MSESGSEQDDSGSYESRSESESESSSVEKKKKKKNGRKKKSKSKKKRGKKKKSKKRGPTRPRTSYALFIQQRREDFAKQNPNADFGGLAKIIANYWKTQIPPEEKKKYEELASEDKVRYTKEVEEYEKTKKDDSSDSSSSEPRRRKSKSKKKKDPNRPKKPINGFLLYSKKFRSEVKTQNQDKNNKEIGQILGQRWKSLSVEDKKPFLDEANVDKLRYEEQMKVYTEKQENENDSEKETK